MTGSRRVQKFRTIEEMNAAQVTTPDEADFARFLRHFARYRALAARTYPRGVVKSRSIEEAERAHDTHTE